MNHNKLFDAIRDHSVACDVISFRMINFLIAHLAPCVMFIMI